jgi:bla regulator protein blaR1
MENKWKGLILLVVILAAALPLSIKFAQELSEPWVDTAQQGREAPPRTRAVPGAWPRPFLDDPSLVGTWTTVDFVQQIGDFEPGVTGWTGSFAFDTLKFMGEGRSSGPWQWSKGFLWHPGDGAEGKYTIKNLSDSDYLFMEWMSGDVLFRGQKPHYYVMKKTGDGAETALDAPVEAEQPNRRTGATWNRPFQKDPLVIGTWQTVDFVERMDDFEPGVKGWTGSFAFEALKFHAGGRTSGPWRWTKGYLWHPGDHAEGRYHVKHFDDRSYLFMEWVSGDVLFRGAMPCYYVFGKQSGFGRR